MLHEYSEWLLIMLALVLSGLDAYALRQVLSSPFYTSGQRWAQAALVLLIPLIGATLVIYMARHELPSDGTWPVDHMGDIDPTCSVVDYHGRAGPCAMWGPRSVDTRCPHALQFPPRADTRPGLTGTRVSGQMMFTPLPRATAGRHGFFDVQM
ncbi:hypothetical protein [Rugamonas aquatica]|uniref:Uncharacterized protein n=1 Tax=Rugamonas aquatica TaxID=2743357 RepID=A0A6A7N6G6_9BURK|nr:hypothetical protein [Rugamonas aquatica]MQA40579.1 hypothetical protein [Rugamonas aquatica]